MYKNYDISNHDLTYHTQWIDNLNYTTNPVEGTWCGITDDGLASNITGVPNVGLIVEVRNPDFSRTDDIKPSQLRVLIAQGLFVGLTQDVVKDDFVDLSAGNELGVDANGMLDKAETNKVFRVYWIKDGKVYGVMSKPTVTTSTGATIESSLDENGDGIVTRKEILDADNDGDNDWNDIVTIGTGNVVD